MALGPEHTKKREDIDHQTLKRIEDRIDTLIKMSIGDTVEISNVDLGYFSFDELKTKFFDIIKEKYLSAGLKYVILI